MKGVPIPQLSCYVSPSEPLVAVRNERQRPKSRVISMGRRNTNSQSTNTSFKSYIRTRASIQSEDSDLFSF
jgi:hypothetical protein